MATYYVGKTNASNGNPGTSTAAPWATIQYAVTNANVNAGDTIKVMPGTYDENISILATNSGRQGSAGSPITLTSSDHENMAVITPTTRGVHPLKIHNRSYWTIDHIAFKNFYSGGIYVLATTQNIVGIRVQNCLFEDQDASADDGGPMRHTIVFDGNEPYSTSYSYVTNNTLRNVTTGPTAGYNEGITAHHNCHHILFEGNTIINGSYIGMNAVSNDYASGTGKPQYIIMRNNRIDLIKVANWGTRTALYVDGADYVLIENNYVTRANGLSVSAECWSAKGKYTEFKYNIARNNVFDGTSGDAGIMHVQGADHYTVFTGSDPNASQKWVDDSATVHNVFLINASYGGAFKWGFCRRARIKNNIMANYDSGGLITFVMAYLSPNNWVSDGNLYWRPNNPAFSWPGAGNPASLAALRTASGNDYSSIYGEPAFANKDGGDYRLTDSSLGSGAAVPLTTATETKTSATELKVGDARYFCDGYGLIGGDKIRVGGELVTVTAVNYATNTLTITPAISWVAGARVDYDYPGTAPSIGLTTAVSSGDINNPPPVEEPPPDEIPDPGTVLNTDPTFTNGMASWQFYSTGGNYTVSASGGVVTVVGNQAGSFTQLMQTGIKLQTGVTYQVTLRARASIASSVRSQLLFNGVGATYNSTEISLTTDYKTQVYTFVSSYTDSDTRVRIEFLPQASSTTYDIDTFQIEVAGDVVAPESSFGDPDDATVVAGESATFLAYFTGTTPTYQWYGPSDTILTNSAKYTGTATVELTVHNVTEADAGGYYCIASNSAGEAISRVGVLTVTPAPVVDNESGSMTIYATVDSYASIRHTTWGSTVEELKVGHFDQAQGNTSTVTVGASGDDASTNVSNSWAPTSTSMAVGHLSSPFNYDNEARFLVTLPEAIPSGADVLSASVEIRAFRDTATPGLTIRAELSADASAWASAADFKGRTLTTAGVTWSPSMTGSLLWYESPDISTVIQELVDTYGGLAAGAQIAISIAPASTGWPGSVQGVYISTYDSSPGVAPLLNYSWETSAGDDYDNEAGFLLTLTSDVGDGVTLDTADLTIHAKYSTASPGFKVYAEKTSNATAWADRAAFLGRSLTTAVVNWSPTLTGSYANHTISIKTLIQELLDAYGGLTTGSKIAIRIKPASTGWPGSEQGALIHSVEYNSASNEASLALEWTVTAGGGGGSSTAIWEAQSFGMRAGLKIGL